MYTIEDLKKLREDGKITDAQYRQMARLFCADYVGAHPDEFPEDGQPDTPDPPAASGMDEEALKKLIQTEIDRATNKLGNANKKLEEEKQRLQQQLNGKMTEEERVQTEMARQQQELADREAALTDKENRLYAVRAIKTAGLDDGSDNSLALVDFVLGRTTEDIDTNVKAFNALVKKFVQAEIDRLFKEKGHVPPKGGSGADAGLNPYKQETWNVTQQWELEAKDPEKAAALKAAAGATK